MIKIYERDAYVFEFEGTVTSADGEWVSLDATAFYPGGGGQVCDLGRICGLDVTEVRMKNSDIIHRVPGHSAKTGDAVWCSVDWERRYDLMMGHTAEHLLFGGLRRAVPEIEIVKIFISPESKYVVVDRDVPWEDVMKAQDFVNGAINDNLSVVKSTMGKDDPDTENIRAKMDRIDDDLMTVVEIGDADVAACSGLHVMETSEIGALLVDRKVSAGKDGHAIHFKVGKEAVARSMELANICLRTVEAIGTKPEDSVKAAENLKHENEVMTKQIRSAVSRIVSSLIPETVNGVPVYSDILDVNDRTVVSGYAEKIKEKGGVAVFVTKGDTPSAFVSSGTKKVNCPEILKSAVTKYGGRGGGRPDLAQGGIPGADDASALFDDIVALVRTALEREK